MSASAVVTPTHLKNPLDLSGVRTLARGVAPAVVGFAIVLTVWQALAWTGLEQARILPGPLSILSSMADAAPTIALALPQTLSTAALGYGVGAAAALILGVVASSWSSARDQVVRSAIVLESLPTLALTPIVVIIAPGQTAGAVLAGLSVFFVVVMGTVSGMSEASPQMIELHRAAGGGRVSEMLRIRLHAALPTIFSSLLLGIPLAFVGTIMAEFLVVGTGIGAAMLAAYEALDTAKVWAFALVTALATGASFAIVIGIRALVVPWATTKQVEYRARPHTPFRWRRAAATFFGGIVTIVIVLGLWWIGVSAFGLSPFFAKTPLDVWNYLVVAPEAGANLAEILGYLGPTLSKAMIGLALGTAAAVTIAWVVVSYPLLERAFMPVFITMRSIPLLALIPVIALLVGSGPWTAIILAAVTSVFTTLIMLVQAARFTPRDVVHLASAYNTRPLEFRARVVAPFALPQFFAALKITAPAALVSAMSAEWLMTGDGIGALMIQGGMESRFTTMWAGFVVMSVTSILIFSLVAAAEKATARRMS